MPIQTPEEQELPSRPLLRYFGGKWAMASWIISQFPKHKSYVEPYGGGGSVLLSKGVVNAEVYGDLDGEIVNLFKVVRDNKAELIEKIELTPYARDEFKASYEPSPDKIEQARRTLVRSWMGFASSATSGGRSGFRNGADRRGYTLPVHDWATLSPVIAQIAQRLRAVIVENRDALAVMRQYDAPETLHYIDPPYVAETRSDTYKAVYRHEMSDDDHVKMLDCLKSLKGMVVVSGYESALYAEHLKGWKSLKREAKAGGKSTGDLSREEMLWLNPACAAALIKQESQVGFDFDSNFETAQ
jgi:DNA adenine methylase